MPFSYRIIVLGRGVNQHFALTNAPKLGKLFLLCGYGGIGRRAGFRVQCPRRAGSSPVSRIVSKRAYLRITNVDTLFFMFFNVLTCSNTLFSRRKSVVKTARLQPTTGLKLYRSITYKFFQGRACCIKLAFPYMCICSPCCRNVRVPPLPWHRR